MEIQLCKPHFKFQNEFLIAYKTLDTQSDRSAWVHLGDDADLDFPVQNFKEYVDTLLLRGTQPLPHFVCDTVHWAFCEKEMVGRISIRHELNDFLKKIGGHVGYIVAPRWRNKGVATKMLSLLLQTSKAQEIGKLLLTCDENNVASEKTILKNGGLFTGIIEVGDKRPKKKHFWIDTL